MAYTIEVPRSLTSKSAVAFAHEIMSLPEADEYIFDFANLNWLEPFGMLFTAQALKVFSARKKAEGDVRCRAQNHQKHGYYGHMGFFQAFGLKFGKEPGEASGSSNYLPITELNIADLYREAHDSGQVIGEVVTGHAINIAKVLTREESGNLYEAVWYAVREVLRNVAEHSQSETVRYCGQYWPTKNKVQIAILDSGIGVANSLSNNPYLEIENDADALKLATMPGISGKMFEGVEVRPYDDWQNSGYGLYMIYRMCRRAGSMFMTSNDATLEVISDTHEATLQNGLPGTSIRIQFNTRRLDELKDQLKRYSQEGRKQAEKIEGAQTIKASAASVNRPGITLTIPQSVRRTTAGSDGVPKRDGPFDHRTIAAHHVQ